MKPTMKELEKSFFMKFAVATLCLVLIFAISIAHSKYMDQKISDISKIYLSKISRQNAEIVSSQIRTNLASLDVIARMIESQEDFTIENIGNMLLAERQNSDYVSLGVILRNGKIAFTPINMDTKTEKSKTIFSGELQDGRALLLAADWEYIGKILNGHVGLSSTPSRIVNGEVVNVYAVPIHRIDTDGVLVAFFNEDFFKSLVFPETLDESGCTYIADRNGNIIFRSVNCSSNKKFAGVVERLSDGWSMEGATSEKIRDDIAAGRDGTVKYDQNDDEIYISYASMSVHCWYLVTIHDSTIAEAQSKSIYDDIMPAFIYVLIIILTVSIYFVYMRNQSYKRLERKMQLESINDESYRMIMEQTDDIIFEYDTMDKTYFHTANFQKNFGYQPTKTGFLGSLEYDYVHQDDVVRFAELYEKMKQDRKIAEAEVRIINSEGEYLWTRIFMLGVFDKEGRLAKVIGKIVNIDEKKKELQYLKEMAVMDSATGVYNKQTTEDMIRAFLNGEGKSGKHAMLIIDIDDFKEINDDHGHRVGDAVISALGIQLNRIFRTTDIKGRIGGDEFMILMKDIEDMDLIVSKAKDICQMVGNYELDGKKKINFSVSIGIAIYDLNGSTYEELYESADCALYNCKNCQKGTYAFCK